MDGSGWDSEDTVTRICILNNQTVRLASLRPYTGHSVYSRESERETQQKNRIILDEEVLNFIEKSGNI
jgi:hypothetical protein